MLRRPPTQITLTAEDIATYEENRLARLAQQAAAARHGSLAVSSDGTSIETAQRGQSSSVEEGTADIKPTAASAARNTRQSSLAAQAGNATQGTSNQSDTRSRAERIMGRQN